MTRAIAPLRHPPARTRAEQEFLPAALAILETPPSPVRIGMMWAICLIAASGMGFGWFGRIDIIASAPGALRPRGDVKTVEPLYGGRIAAIDVENGAVVKAGHALIELDRTEAEADRATSVAALASTEAEIARRALERDAVAAERLDASANPAPLMSSSVMSRSADFPDEFREREQSVLRADLDHLDSSIATLKAQAMKQADEENGLRATIAAEKDLIDVDDQRARTRRELAQRGAGTQSDLVNALETLRYQQMMMAQFQAASAQAQASRAVAERQIRETYDKFLDENEQKLEQAQRAADELQQRLTKQTRNLDAMTLRSPIDGTVVDLRATTIGQVLPAGAEVLRVAPRDAELEIKAYLSDADRGFVKLGDVADVKVASFPFTRYGTSRAVVTRIAADAVPQSDAMETTGNPAARPRGAATGDDAPAQGLVYPVTLSLDRNAASGAMALSSGMSVQVEIKTGRRRLLDYLFAPLAEVGSSAMKER